MSLIIILSLLTTALYFSFAELKRLHRAVTKKQDQPRDHYGRWTGSLVSEPPKPKFYGQLTNPNKKIVSVTEL